MRHFRRVQLITVVLCLLPPIASAGEELLHPLFQDHAVLQRDRPVRIWGATAPGAEVVIELAATRTTTRAAADGTWHALLPQLAAGGPHELTVHSSTGETRTLRDVLIGDVWLCSGQSNMEMPVRRVTNWEVEISESANDRIRLLTVQQASSPVALRTFASPVAWRAAAPDTVAGFSAACYFLGRDLHKATGVPQGLIHSSWGGSIIQTWISAAGLHELGNYDEGMRLLELYAAEPEQAGARWLETLDAWFARNDPGAARWPALALDDADWSSMEPHGLWENAGIATLRNRDGVVWFRKTIQLTREQARDDATLSLGPIDDSDTTWINGVRVGATDGWNVQRDYAISRGVLRAGKNVIAVRVLDTGGGGGMWSEPGRKALRFASSPAVALDGAWRYRISGSLTQTGLPPHTPWLSAGGLTTLYNAMIAPLAGFGLRGVAWYQGEANVMEAGEYARLLPLLFKDWRAAFGADLPFLVVQLANFGPASSEPGDSQWAAVREVQRRAVDADGNAALAVAIDVGERYDIHPTNKQEIGRRLALAARRLVFKENVSAAGPTPTDARRVGDQIVVSFTNAGGGLIVYGAARPVGFELCDARAHCRFVDATVRQDQIVLDASGLPEAANVRYGWADSPICNLYNSNELPAVPFEIPVHP